VSEFYLLNAVSSLRNGCPGHDSDCLAGGHFVVPTLTGNRFTDDFQADRRGCNVLSAYRISIHLSAVKRRHIKICNYVFGEYLVQSLIEQDLFYAKRLSFVDDYLNCFGDRDHFFLKLRA